MHTLQRFRATLQQGDSTTATSILVPFDIYETFGSRARVPVRGTLNGTPYRSSVFPYSGQHYLIVNAALRAQAGLKAGDEVDVTIERDDEPRLVDVPPDLEAALAQHPAARAAWDKLSYSHKREYAEAIAEARRPETRARRIAQAVAQLIGS